MLDKVAVLSASLSKGMVHCSEPAVACIGLTEQAAHLSQNGEEFHFLSQAIKTSFYCVGNCNAPVDVSVLCFISIIHL